VRRDESSYVRVHRRWQAGDLVELELPMRLRFEPTPDDSATVALLHGPLVLAADLGPASAPFGGPEPALVGDDPLAAITATKADLAHYETRAIGRPTDLSLAPFFNQHDRRTAVYFKRYTRRVAGGAHAARRRKPARGRAGCPLARHHPARPRK
jgi:DUF1680 family protein